MLMNPNPDRFSLTYDNTPCRPEDIVLIFYQEQVLLRAEDQDSRLPNLLDTMDVLGPLLPRHAFTFEDRRVFIVNAASALQAGAHTLVDTVRTFRTMLPEEDAYSLLTAYHLSVWYRKNAFCGVCGQPTQPAPSERAITCPSCGHIIYPIISPAVIVAITDQDRLLLARNAYGVFHHFSLIAGFVEVGESLEQALRREIMEEVGLRVKNIRYLASQAWGLSQSLMLGFHAELDGSPEITLQTSELAEARWFSKQELPDHANLSSIAFETIERFRTGQLG